MRGLEIRTADWCLGMFGHITFQPRPDGLEHTLRHSPTGLLLDGERVEMSDVLELLDPYWTEERLLMTWQAFAEGQKRGVNMVRHLEW